MADHTRSKIPTPRKAKLSTKRKKLHLSPREHKEKSRETRVDIGLSFKAWRSMKAAKGWKTDALVAQSLMDMTKTMPSKVASPGASDEKITFSQSELQTLVEQEVQATVEKRTTRLYGLIKTIQNLDRAVDYETSMKKLETRINRISKRAEAAIAFMTKTKKERPLPSSVNAAITSPDSVDEAMETSVQSESPAADKKTDCEDDKREVLMVMEHTKEALKNMRSESKALTGAVAALSGELPPPVLTPDGSPEVTPKEELKIENNVAKAEPRVEPKAEPRVEPKAEPRVEPKAEPRVEPKAEPRVEPKAEPVKVERLPLCESDDPKDADSEQVKPLYPPLPTNTFPSILHMTAASYNIPQRPQVRLALIRNPAGLSVLWNSVEDDASRPPMAAYSVYMTVEKVKGSNVFPDWTCSQVDAKPLPMCMMISKYKPGRKVCVAVVGKDKFGRYGPYSSVVTASLPE